MAKIEERYSLFIFPSTEKILLAAASAEQRKYSKNVMAYGIETY